MINVKIGIQSLVGIQKSYSLEELKSYLTALVNQYKSEADKYGDMLGIALRGLPMPTSASSKPKKGVEKPKAEGLIATGSLKINANNPLPAHAEALLEIHEDFKHRISGVEQAMKSLEEIPNLGASEKSAYTLYLASGIPTRLVIEGSEESRPNFAFSASFRTV